MDDYDDSDSDDSINNQHDNENSNGNGQVKSDDGNKDSTKSMSQLCKILSINL